METFMLVPTERCGDLDFLADRKTVRETLGKHKKFFKSKSSENSTDDFGFCHAFYSPADQLIAIEFFPEAELHYNGQELFELTAAELVKLLTTKDTATTADDYAITSKKLGISAEIDEGEIKSILACRADYFN